MIEFFLAIFGSIFLLFKLIFSEYDRCIKDRDDDKRKQELEQAQETCMTTLDLEDTVKKYVRENYERLVTREFKDDLEYIYGDGLEDLQDSIYDLRECVIHLVLSKYYKKLRYWMRSYKAGIGKQTSISLRLFRVINKYLNSEEYELTMVPSINKGGMCTWGPYGAEFLPAIRNLYSHMEESREQSWGSYCVRGT